jgi:hypothetical protein
MQQTPNSGWAAELQVRFTVLLAQDLVKNAVH